MRQVLSSLEDNVVYCFKVMGREQFFLFFVHSSECTSLELNPDHDQLNINQFIFRRVWNCLSWDSDRLESKERAGVGCCQNTKRYDSVGDSF